MFIFLSVISSVKDYVEVVHKLIESGSTDQITTYYDFGAILTYSTLLLKDLLVNILSFKWLQNIWSLPVIIPNIASAMISEISVLDGYFHNIFTFLESPISYGNQNTFLYCLEKFTIGLINSLFFCLPTSAAHIITLRRFVIQGVEAGFISGLGTIAGNLLWIGSIIFGFRFIVIPWLSFDIFRYLVGFVLLVKFMWDSYSDKKTVLEDVSKVKIFLLTFLLAFIEQTNIYPFISNLSIGSDSTILEGFVSSNFVEFLSIHCFYLLGLLIGSLSLLQFTCWFWENPAFSIYMWMMSSFKITTSVYYKIINFFFLYLTMICTISSLAYFSLDYTLTNPLGFVHEDRIIDQKILLETTFLNSKASDRNTRRNLGRHGRRERWKRRVRRYRTFDASLYDQGVYDLFTIEDLNYGFDRFWLRRKMRNHRVRFRFFPGPWMRSFKKQLARPRLESFMGPRVDFFRILFEQTYHPEFHEFRQKNIKNNLNSKERQSNSQSAPTNLIEKVNLESIYSIPTIKKQKDDILQKNSTLRKFVRKMNTRFKSSEINLQLEQKKQNVFKTNSIKPIYSKRWKEILSKMNHKILDGKTKNQETIFKRLYKEVFFTKLNKSQFDEYKKSKIENQILNSSKLENRMKQDIKEKLSKKDRQVLRYRSFLIENSVNPLMPYESKNNISTDEKSLGSKIEKLSTIENYNSVPVKQTNINLNISSSNLLKNRETEIYKPMTLLHPLKFYLQKEQAFQRKLKFYGINIYRNIGIENNASYFRTMMQKFFYYYKPTLRWERTMRVATMRKARRKSSRILRKINMNKKEQALTLDSLNNESSLNREEIQKPTHFYSLVNKRANRYRYQIYKDVLQHWYYNPFNRLFLKLDVDSFIRRQPTSYFLTKKEEQLLHLKRFLLAEHYNTLRWYTYMQHYSTMKNHIGGTKSFASRIYNQQFYGTFKKIRHLFAITPSLTDSSILKFDQSLYNEYLNTGKNSILNESLIHEELLIDENIYPKNSSINKKENGNLNSVYNSKSLLKDQLLDYPEDLTGQSTKIVRKYLFDAKPIREKLIERLINEKNYWELTNFLFKGQKVRGNNPTTNENELLEQEKNALFSNLEKIKLNEKQTTNLNNLLFPSLENNGSIKTPFLWKQDKLWFSLIQKCQNQLYDQEALRIYVSRHHEKNERQKQRLEKAFTLRLERLKNWYLYQNEKTFNKNENSNLTTTLQKAIKEGLYYQKNWNLVKSNIRNNRPIINWSKIQTLNSKDEIMSKNKINIILTNRLKYRIQSHQLEISKIEKNLINKLKIDAKLQQNVNRNSFKVQNVNLHSISEVTVKKLYNLVTKVFLSPINKIKKTFEFNRKNESQLSFWRKQENVLTRRKKTRKTFKRLKNQNKRNREQWIRNELNNSKISSLQISKNTKKNSDLRKKEDIAESISERNKTETWKEWKKSNQTQKLLDLTSNNRFSNTLNFKQFKRKKSRLRRYRRLKGRGPIKKRTLGEKLKRQFKLLKKYSRSESSQNLEKQLDKSNKKVEIFQLITKRKYDAESKFEPRETKQRRTRQQKRRSWKQKKQKYAQNKRKLRKRRRYAVGKIRVLNKQLKRIKSNIEIRNWWWKKFIPNIQAETNYLSQVNRENEIKKKLSELSISDILNRDRFNLMNSSENSLQIGNKDYKPLAIPEALRIREKLQAENKLKLPSDRQNIEKLTNTTSNFAMETQKEYTGQNNDFVEKISQNLLVNNITNENSIIYRNTLNIDENKLIVGINPFPFYAGWDETLRKFVVTNRYLSLREAGYENKTLNSILKSSNTPEKGASTNFSSAPLQGMNAATTLYWQIPFTTYDPDQFFTLGLDGFSPIAWRNFNFRYSVNSTKPILVKTKTMISNLIKNNSFSYNIQSKILQNQYRNKSLIDSNKKFKKFEIRRLQKRYKRVKRHPKPPVWFPSGPLTTQVLPVHYIYVFYKRSRLPRDRYIRRRLRRNKDGSSVAIRNSIVTYSGGKDYTLRKRVKPRRKYHRKRTLRKNEQFLLRRRKFKNLSPEITRFRPNPKNQIFDQNETNYLKSKLKQRTKKSSAKQNPENLRIRQLRRRVQRQVLRPIWRYKPRSGGFGWPGDYLKLELVRSPRLNSEAANKVNQLKLQNSSKKAKKKKRKSIQEWQLQPKKILLQKHNLKVLENRLEKSQNIQKIYDQIYGALRPLQKNDK